MNSKPYTTYLLGAGASANALPVLSEMPRRMAEFTLWLLTQKPNLFTEKEILELKKHIQNCAAYGTPDTYAKMLHFSKSEDIGMFKWFLTLFFMHEQTSLANERATTPDKDSPFFELVTPHEYNRNAPKNVLDYRYPHLFASMFDSIDLTTLLNKNIRFITWNYDIQIALFLKQVLKLELNETYNFLNQNPSDYRSSSRYKMQYFLNGSAILRYREQHENYIVDMEDKKNILKYAGKIFESRNFEENLLRYSWDTKDRESEFTNYISEVQDLLRDSKRLIVIGYSFPTYNRILDKRILSEFNGYVTIQSKEAKTIESRISSVLPPDTPKFNRDEKYHLIDDVSNFYIPDDLLV